MQFAGTVCVWMHLDAFACKRNWICCDVPHATICATRVILVSDRQSSQTISARGLRCDVVCIDVSKSSSKVLVRRLSAHPATLALNQETNPLRAHLAATTLTVTRLIEAREHDGVQHCDSCRFIRFCHYGYSAGIRESSIIGYEAVNAL